MSIRVTDQPEPGALWIEFVGGSQDGRGVSIPDGDTASPLLRLTSRVGERRVREGYVLLGDVYRLRSVFEVPE